MRPVNWADFFNDVLVPNLVPTGVVSCPPVSAIDIDVGNRIAKASAAQLKDMRDVDAACPPVASIDQGVAEGTRTPGFQNHNLAL